MSKTYHVLMTCLKGKNEHVSDQSNTLPSRGTVSARPHWSGLARPAGFRLVGWVSVFILLLSSRTRPSPQKNVVWPPP